MQEGTSAEPSLSLKGIYFLDKLGLRICVLKAFGV